eukprot:2514024-Pleurochrysis_carterae.AAC.3
MKHMPPSWLTGYSYGEGVSFLLLFIVTGERWQCVALPSAPAMSFHVSAQQASTSKAVQSWMNLRS